MRTRGLLILLAAGAVSLTAQSTPPMALVRIAVDSVPHSHGKLATLYTMRPTTLRSEEECRQVKLPAIGGKETGTYWPAVVQTIVAPPDPRQYGFYSIPYWIHVNRLGVIDSINFVVAPPPGFAEDYGSRLAKGSYLPAIYQACVVDSWLYQHTITTPPSVGAVAPFPPARAINR